MVELKTKLRKWGNSFGVVVPLNVLEDDLRENDEVNVLITKTNPNLKKLFGRLKGWKIDSQKFKEEIREEESKNGLFS